MERLWADEIVRVYTENKAIEEMFRREIPPQPWLIAQWNRLKYRIREARQWLGEKVAGRSFDEYF